MSGRGAAAGALELAAPAKVNLGLAVLARRGDGYHEIDTLLAALELADGVRVAPRPEGIALTVEAPGGAAFAGVPADARNLAWRAADAFLAAAEFEHGVEIALAKRVPVAAGLGGGSSDAAAVLCALADLYPEAAVDLGAVALELGSDVPFFVAARQRGWRAARGRGRGERLERFELPSLPLVLANPGVPVSAADAYRALQNFSARPRWERIAEQLAAGETPRWINALQPGVLLAHPEVRAALDALRASEGLQGALMSGSGGTCFAVAASDAAAEAAAEALAVAHPDWWVAATRLRGAP